LILASPKKSETGLKKRKETKGTLPVSLSLLSLSLSLAFSL